MVYLYFVAMGHGNLQPMLDFIIDGKYDDKYVNTSSQSSANQRRTSTSSEQSTHFNRYLLKENTSHI